jgi:thioredoxin-like negative regulator of GroEL
MALSNKRPTRQIYYGEKILKTASLSSASVQPLLDFVVETLANAYLLRAETSGDVNSKPDYQRALNLFIKTFQWQAAEKNTRQVTTLCRIACCYFRLGEYAKAESALTDLSTASENKKDALLKLLALSTKAKESEMTTDLQQDATPIINSLIFG